MSLFRLGSFDVKHCEDCNVIVEPIAYIVRVKNGRRIERKRVCASCKTKYPEVPIRGKPRPPKPSTRIQL